MSDKDKNLSEALSQIEKQFIKGTVMKMGDREIVDIPSVSTGSLQVWILLWELEVFQREGWLKFLGLNHLEKQH